MMKLFALSASLRSRASKTQRAWGSTKATRQFIIRQSSFCISGPGSLQNLRLMQSLTAAQNAGNTLVLGMPGGFVPLKQSAKPASTKSTEAT